MHGEAEFSQERVFLETLANAPGDRERPWAVGVREHHYELISPRNGSRRLLP